MNLTIDIDDDMFDDMFLKRLVSDYQMLRDDIANCPHLGDVSWMIAAKNALETLIMVYYSDNAFREEFLKEIANGS